MCSSLCPCPENGRKPYLPDIDEFKKKGRAKGYMTFSEQNDYEILGAYAKVTPLVFNSKDSKENSYSSFE